MANKQNPEGLENQTDNETVTAADVKSMKKDELVALIEDNELDVDGYKDMKVDELKAALLKVLDLEEVEEEAPAKGNGKSGSVGGKAKGTVYTYIGKGADSPRIIKLMGKQEFVRGKAVEVTDEDLLAKLPGMQTFVKGEADQETLHQIDQEGKAAEEQQKAKDLVTNAAFTKKHRGE